MINTTYFYLLTVPSWYSNIPTLAVVWQRDPLAGGHWYRDHTSRQEAITASHMTQQGYFNPSKTLSIFKT